MNQKRKLSPVKKSSGETRSNGIFFFYLADNIVWGRYIGVQDDGQDHVGRGLAPLPGLAEI